MNSDTDFGPKYYCDNEIHTLATNTTKEAL